MPDVSGDTAYEIAPSRTASQPENAATFGRVIDRVLDEFKAEIRQKSLIFGVIEARMIQRITSIRADGFAVTKARVEHKNGATRRVCGKHAKHRFLIRVPEMKEAV